MDWWLYCEVGVAVSALLYVVYVWITWNNDVFKRAGLPYDEPMPLLGTLGPFWLGRASLAEIMLESYNRFKGKSVVGVLNFRSPGFTIQDVDLINKMTTKDFNHFVDRPELGANDDPLFGINLFGLKGSRWKSVRNILTPAFTSSKMKGMFTLIVESGKQLGDHIEEKCKEESGLLVADMKDLFARYANDVIATSAFGLHCNSLKDPNNEFYLVGKEAMDFSGSRIFVFLLHFLAPKLAKLLDIPVTPHRVNNFFQNLIRDTMRTREREGIVRPDMINLLMQAQKGTLMADDGGSQEKQDGGNRERITLTDGDITAQAFLFFAAGSDTSSTLHCFMSHLLAVHPDVQRRVQQEIDDILQEDGGKLTYEGIVQRAKYLDMVVSETLRLWPPVLQLDRMCVKDYTIPATASMPAVEIKKGQDVSFPVFAIHRDPDFYPDPERFDLERFSEDNKKSLNQLAYLPFGTGPRVCIGLRFALMATKIMAVSLLSRFDLEVTSKTAIPLRHEKKTFNTTVEGGFWLAIRPRVKH